VSDTTYETITLPRRNLITLSKLVEARIKKLERQQRKFPWNPSMGLKDQTQEAINSLELTLDVLYDAVGEPE
jgi:hypothetical protein